MRVLLDTHAFLWALAGDPQLSAGAARVIDAADTERVLSVASLWEIAIKHSLGKLTAPVPLVPTLLDQIAINGIVLLPIEPVHALGVDALPMNHRDPFDRLLVVQCLTEKLPIVSRDAILDAYGVRRIW